MNKGIATRTRFYCWLFCLLLSLSSCTWFKRGVRPSGGARGGRAGGPSAGGGGGEGPGGLVPGGGGEAGPVGPGDGGSPTDPGAGNPGDGNLADPGTQPAPDGGDGTAAGTHGENPGAGAVPPDGADGEPEEDSLGELLPKLIHEAPEGFELEGKKGIDELRTAVKEGKLSPFKLAYELTQAIDKAHHGIPAASTESFVVDFPGSLHMTLTPPLKDDRSALKVSDASQKLVEGLVTPSMKAWAEHHKDDDAAVLLHDWVAVTNGLLASLQVTPAVDPKKLGAEFKLLLERTIQVLGATRAASKLDGDNRKKLVQLVAMNGDRVWQVLLAGDPELASKTPKELSEKIDGEWKAFLLEDFKDVPWVMAMFGLPAPDEAAPPRDVAEADPCAGRTGLFAIGCRTFGPWSRLTGRAHAPPTPRDSGESPPRKEEPTH